MATHGTAGAGTGYPDLSSAPEVAAAIAQARDALARLHRHPVNRRGWPRTSAAASVRAARASAALDGGDASVDRQAATVTDPVLAGALRVSAALGSLVAVWERSPLQALARLHTEAAADLVTDPDLLGRPMRQAARLAALASLVADDPWPAPVVVAVVHVELLTLRPFGSADGVVARGAARLAALASGLDPHGLGVPEVAQLRAGVGYRRAATEVAAGTPGGLDRWIVRSCGWLADGAREGGSIADAAGVE